MCKIIPFTTAISPLQPSAPMFVANGYATVSVELLKNYWTQKGFPVTNNIFVVSLLAPKEDGLAPVFTTAGSLCRHNDECKQFTQVHQSRLLESIASFTKANFSSVLNGKTIFVDGTGEDIAIIAAPCNQGVYIAAWLNELSDIFLARQMLAFALYCFAAMNSVYPSGDIKDEKLHLVYQKVPNDLRLGLDKETATQVLTEYSMRCLTPPRQR